MCLKMLWLFSVLGRLYLPQSVTSIIVQPTGDLFLWMSKLFGLYKFH